MNTIIYIVFVALAWVAAMQVSVLDLKRMRGKINSRWMPSNTIAVVCTLLCIIAFAVDCWKEDILLMFIVDAVMLVLSAGWLWIMGKANVHAFWQAFLLIFVPLIIAACAMSLLGSLLLFPFAVYGFYYRNCPFGNLFGKKFLLISDGKSTEPVEEPTPDVEVEQALLESLQDFSLAGCQHEIKPTTRYNVEDEGIKPNGQEDVLCKVQQLIDHVGVGGGGSIYFPRGKYLFNKDQQHPAFLQINYSNVTLEGEVDDAGRPLAELVNCNSTVRGRKNPWLSPFFITTGESLQESNMFWGVQFKKKKDIVTHSSSLSDPGSDGSILSPDYATDITCDAKKGELTLRVKDASRLAGVKFIMVALFNNHDGDLIKDILCVEELRPEWGTALRAGEEMAPSYQTLLEVEHIDEKTRTITLTQPLRRDILLKYHPEIYAVEMLEDVTIKNLVISSKWNGLFRHHGFPIYYSVGQTQEMDYGWNGINMKRVAHGRIENIVFRNMSNPLYIMDSRNITAENILFTGYDGHQGIKIYEHACDNLLRKIEFRNHYADMMGGEGNAYGNVFTRVRYTNPYLKPVDYDFHGFSEGPMSPPSYNLFELVEGFAHIKAGGASFNQPASARENMWWNVTSEGGTIGDNLFIAGSKSKAKMMISALGHAIVGSIKRHDYHISNMWQAYKDRLITLREQEGVSPKFGHIFFAKHLLVGAKTQSVITPHPQSTVEVLHPQQTVSPLSLYEYQWAHTIGKHEAP